MTNGKLLIAAVVSFQAGSALAGACRSIEYAELKDTPSERLATIYCEYGKLARREQSQIPSLKKLVIDFKNMGMHRASRDTEGDIERTDASAKECIDMQDKISSALKNRSEPAPPSCGLDK